MLFAEKKYVGDAILPEISTEAIRDLFRLDLIRMQKTSNDINAGNGRVKFIFEGNIVRV